MLPVYLKAVLQKKLIKGVKYKKLDLKKFKNIRKINKNYGLLVNSSGYINNNTKTKYKKDHFKILKNLVEHFKNSKIKSFLQIGTSAEYGGKIHLKLKLQNVNQNHLWKR